MIPLPLLARTRLDLGLISAWRFEEATSVADGNAADSVGSNTLFGVDGWTSIAGKIGNAIRLSPSGLEVTTNDFNFITNPFSIAFWFKRSSGTDTLQIKYQGAVIAYTINVADTFLFVDYNDATDSATDTFTVSNDTWTFVCARYDSTNLYINVNARAEVSVAAATMGDATGGTLTVTPSGTVTIDNMLIADVCWTDAQVALLAGGFQG